MVTAPIDRIKLLYQIDSNQAFNLRHGVGTVQRIVETSGVSALWRGNTAALARDVPYAAILFSTFSIYEDAICTGCGRPPGLSSRLLAGSAAGATATFLTYPLDVLRARYAADLAAKPRHGSYALAVREILKREGISALFFGLRPTLLGIVPYSGLAFASFETLKASMRRMLGLGAAEPLPAAYGLAAGAAAGLFAQGCTYPLHIVRRRMQVHGVGGGRGAAGAAGAVAAYDGIVHGLRTIYANEGLLNGLFKGFTLTLLKGPLQSAIGFAVNDHLKGTLASMERRRWGGGSMQPAQRCEGDVKNAPR